MGEIFYEKGKKYNCRVKGIPYYRTSVTVNGKRKQIYGDGEKDAARKKKELIKLAESGINIDAQKQKVSAVFEHWLFSVKRLDKNLKASSFSRYASSYRKYVAPMPIASLPLLSLSSMVFQEYTTSLYEEYRASNPTIQAVLKVWKMFFAWALEEGLINRNPMRNVVVSGKYDKKKNPLEFFTSEERAKILYCLDNSDYFYDALIRLAFATGMREGELFALRWEDVHGDYVEVRQSTGMIDHTDKDGNVSTYREVWEPKTINAYRSIPLLPETQSMLAEHRIKQAKYFSEELSRPAPEYVFTNKEGELIKAGTFRNSYRSLLARAGVPYRKFHAVRHTFGTEAVRRGVNVKDLQMLMGHANMVTTYIYVHADETSKAEAINLMGNLM